MIACPKTATAGLARGRALTRAFAAPRTTANRRPVVAPRSLSPTASVCELTATEFVPEEEYVRVTLSKPIGVVFEQLPEGGPVFVGQLVEGGAAARSGKIRQGDILSKCSAIVLKAGKEGRYEKEGYGERPYDNWETIEYDCEGKDFKTVMTALRSNNERWGKRDITLTLRRP